MKRKRFIKLMMSVGYTRNWSNYYADWCRGKSRGHTIFINDLKNERDTHTGKVKEKWI